MVIGVQISEYNTTVKCCEICISTILRIFFDKFSCSCLCWHNVCPSCSTVNTLLFLLHCVFVKTDTHIFITYRYPTIYSFWHITTIIRVMFNQRTCSCVCRYNIFPSCSVVIRYLLFLLLVLVIANTDKCVTNSNPTILRFKITAISRVSFNQRTSSCL